MKSLRPKLLGSASVTALILLAGSMVLAHATGFEDPSDCGPSGSPSVQPSGSPSGGPSGSPSPSPSGEPCPSGSPSVGPSDSGTPNPTRGTLTGVLTTSSGGPLAFADISAVSRTGSFHFYDTGTDAKGRYRIDGVVPGKYVLSFRIPGTSLTQWLHRKKTPDGANPITVTAGHVTVANDQELPTGVIKGRFRDRSGHPISAEVTIFTSDRSVNAFTQTDASGAYTATVFTGSYAVQFTYAAGTIQYAPQQLDPAAAKRYAVTSGGTVTVDDTAVASGSVTGRILQADGTPASGATVNVNGATNGEQLSTRTGPDGTYRIDFAPVGTYTVELFTPDFQREQWVPHTMQERQATLVPVKAGQASTVNDRFLATGTLKVTATDPAGKAVGAFCADIFVGENAFSACPQSGPAILTGVPAGTYDVVLSPNRDTLLSTTLHNVAVAAGGVTPAGATLARAGVIETTTLDARTHQPVAGVCVVAVSPGGERHQPVRGCSDGTGKVRLGRLDNAAYTLMARPTDGVHGMQWVGPSGGTGSQYLARQVTPAPGQVTAVPPIQLDRAGTIAGLVSDAATGKGVNLECVDVTPVGGDPTFDGVCQGALSDAAGHYTLTGVGPYAWPVEFSSVEGNGYAWQWSGGVASRKQATLVPVGAGRTATVNAKLSRGTTVSGTVLGTNGAPLQSTVVLVNSDTGDDAGWATPTIGRYAVGVLPQAVRIRYTDPRTPAALLWYKKVADFTHATPVAVGSTAVTVDLVGL